MSKGYDFGRLDLLALARLDELLNRDDAGERLTDEEHRTCDELMGRAKMGEAARTWAPSATRDDDESEESEGDAYDLAVAGVSYSDIERAPETPKKGRRRREKRDAFEVAAELIGEG